MSIRKVLGAQNREIIFLAGKSFFILILIATIIGSTISYLGNKAWLDLFAYRISFGLDLVAISIGFLIVITGLTIGTQALKASNSNPADVLRNE